MNPFAQRTFPDRARDSFDDSVWQSTAIARPDFPKLAGNALADVAIVGAGYTGLSAALHLAGRGQRVTVLEAREPGYGASGRNGGQVIPLLKYEPDELVARFGDEVGHALIRLVADSADEVFGLVERHGLDCDAHRSGWIQAAWGKNGGDVIRRRHDAWKRFGAPVRLLVTGEMQGMTGSRYYAEGWIHEAAGTVNPLGYVRSLALAAHRAGASVFSESPVLRLARRGQAWVLSCPEGEVEAETVVLATNGYTTGLWPGLRQSLVPLYSMQVASAPLPRSLAVQILPGGQPVSDTRRLVWYFRRDRDDRFVLGARGPFEARPTQDDGTVLVRAARRLYPSLADVDFPFVWSGRVAMTVDHMPHLHRLAPGLIAAVGYNGRGVAMATTLGRVVAAACVERGERIPEYPVTELRRIPLHAFHRLGVMAVVSYYRLLDRLS